MSQISKQIFLDSGQSIRCHAMALVAMLHGSSLKALLRSARKNFAYGTTRNELQEMRTLL